MTGPTPPRLYLITDRTCCGDRTLLDTVESALRGGVDAVQVREKDLSTGDLVALGRQLVTLCRDYRAKLLVNDRVDVALAVGADGVHLPAASFRVGEAREILGAGKIVAVSTHSAAEARSAAVAGADFVLLGPVYDTPSKRRFGPALGVDELRNAVRHCPAPVVAVGGIDTHRASQLGAAGAAGIAVIRALLTARDPERAAAQLRSALARRD